MAWLQATLNYQPNLFLCMNVQGGQIWAHYFFISFEGQTPASCS